MITIIENTHPLIKKVAEALADGPTDCYFVRKAKSHNPMWEIFLNPDWKTGYDEKRIKFIAAFSDHDKTENICETLNNFNLAKCAIEAMKEPILEVLKNYSEQLQLMDMLLNAAIAKSV